MTKQYYSLTEFLLFPNDKSAKMKSCDYEFFFQKYFKFDLIYEN